MILLSHSSHDKESAKTVSSTSRFIFETLVPLFEEKITQEAKNKLKELLQMCQYLQISTLKSVIFKFMEHKYNPGVF